EEEEEEDTPLPPESGGRARASGPAASPPARGGGPAAQPPDPISPKAWFDRVDALLAELPGINRTTTGLANVAPLRALCEPTNGEASCDWGLDVEPAIRAVAASCASSGRGLRSWTHPAIADTAKANRDARLKPPPEETHGQRDFDPRRN